MFLKILGNDIILPIKLHFNQQSGSIQKLQSLSFLAHAMRQFNNYGSIHKKMNMYNQEKEEEDFF